MVYCSHQCNDDSDVSSDKDITSTQQKNVASSLYNLEVCDMFSADTDTE